MLSEFVHLKKQFWGRHLWDRGYLAISSGNITEEMIQKYIEEDEGEPVNADDSRFQIDPSWPPRLLDEGCLVGLLLQYRQQYSFNIIHIM